MKTSIVPIGKSQGVRISKSTLKKCGLGKSVYLQVAGRKIVISSAPTSNPREGWEEAFQKAAAEGYKDEPVVPDSWTR